MLKKILQVGVWMACMILIAVERDNLHAQVVSPPIDATEPVYMPSASAWRSKIGAGGEYHENSGERQISGSTVYNFEGTGTAGILAVPLENFFFEVSSSSDSINTTIEQSYSGQIESGKTSTLIGVGIKGNDFIAIGIGTRSNKTEFSLLDEENDEEKKSVSQNSTIGSLSLKIADWLFLGGGFERFKESGDFAVDNRWQNTSAGIALRFGEPDVTAFRLEASTTVSPRAVTKASEETEVDTNAEPEVDAIHERSVVSRQSLDLLYEGLLISLKNEEAKKEVDTTDPKTGKAIKEEKTAHSQLGVVWIPEEGLSLGFYFISQSTEQAYEDSFNEFKIKFGYIF